MGAGIPAAAPRDDDSDGGVEEVAGPPERPEHHTDGPCWRCPDCGEENALDVDDCVACGTGRKWAMENPQSQTAERKLDVDGNAYI